jgi:hypothetical protein
MMEKEKRTKHIAKSTEAHVHMALQARIRNACTICMLAFLKPAADYVCVAPKHKDYCLFFFHRGPRKARALDCCVRWASKVEQHSHHTFVHSTEKFGCEGIQ